MCDSFLTLVRGVTVIIAIADYQSLFARKLGVGRVMTLTLTLTKYARTCWRSVGWMKIYYIYKYILYIYIYNKNYEHLCVVDGGCAKSVSVSVSVISNQLGHAYFVSVSVISNQ